MGDSAPGPIAEQESEGQAETTSASRRPLGRLIEIAETLILTIVIFWAIQTFVAQPFEVRQESMLPTFVEGHHLLIDKLSPRWDSYSRGDVIVFNPTRHEGSCTEPGEPLDEASQVPFIKRVIGEPGDRVDLSDGRVMVNGALIDEPYVHGQATDPFGDEESWVVPAGRLFVMGDNRGNSVDSRSFGPVCINEVVGRAWLRYWPINTFGILATPTYPNVPPATATAADAAN